MRGESRIVTLACSLFLAAAPAPVARALEAEEVIDLGAQGVSLELGIPGRVWTGATAAGALLVATDDGIGGFPVHRLDPASGSAELLGTLDPADVSGSPGRSHVLFDASGGVYLLTEQDGMPPQQTLYAWREGDLAPVVDVTAAGISLNLDGATGLLVSVGTVDGRIELASRSSLDADTFEIVRLDPTAGSAASLGTFDVFPTGTGSASPVLASGGAAHFLAWEGMDGPRVLRVAGSALDEVLDVGTAGFRFAPALSGALDGRVLGDGTILVAPSDPAAGGDRHFLRLDPQSDRVALLGTLELDELIGGTTPRGVVVFGPGSATHLIASDEQMPVRQRVYRITTDLALTRVSDLSAQGIEIALGPTPGTVTAGATSDGRLLVASPHPSLGDLRRVHRVELASGDAALAATVDVAEAAGPTATGPAVVCPTGTVFFLLQGSLPSPQQSLFRLDGSVLTEVVDVTGEGLSLDFSTPGGLHAGADGSCGIRTVEPRVASPDLRRVYRLDPALGTAAFQATVDLGVVASMPRAVEAFGLDGALYFLVEDSFPVQQDLYRLDGGALTPLVDLTAQGAELFFGIEGPWAGTSADGAVQVVSADDLDAALRHVHRLDPQQGSAAKLGSFDLELTAAGLPPLVVTSFAPDGSILFLVSGSGLLPAQAVYRVPEPGSCSLAAAVLVSLGGLSRRGQAPR